MKYMRESFGCALCALDFGLGVTQFLHSELCHEDWRWQASGASLLYGKRLALKAVLSKNITNRYSSVCTDPEAGHRSSSVWTFGGSKHTRRQDPVFTGSCFGLSWLSLMEKGFGFRRTTRHPDRRKHALMLPRINIGDGGKVEAMLNR